MMQPPCSSRQFGLGLLFLAIVSPSVFAQNDWYRPSLQNSSVSARDNGAMMRLVRPLSKSVQRSIVQVFSGTRVVSLGTVVSEDGYVLTKQSELTGDVIRVRLPNGEKVGARVTSVRKRNDLALLKLDGEDWGIEPIQFYTEELPTGSFVISPGRAGNTVGFGVLGVRSRRVGHDGRLGVRFFNSGGPATVRDVVDRSGAFDAGIQKSDQILKINGITMLGPEAAINTLRGMYPGDVVRLTIKRGDDNLDVDAIMSDDTILRESRNDAKVNGPRNVRLKGFDAVVQHDTVLAPNQCGGPMLDSSGNVVGINIARAGRVTTYTLPSSLVTAEMIGMLEEARR
ncbi:MAG: PDZ domain-containing protein [Planctomycetota bacterium]